MMKKFTLLFSLAFCFSFAALAVDGDDDKKTTSSSYEKAVSEMAADVMEVEMRMRVYPNPTTGPVNIQLDNEEQLVAQVEVFNLIGKQVMNLGRQSFNPNNPLASNIGENPEGIYFIKITFEDNSTVSRKVILDK